MMCRQESGAESWSVEKNSEVVPAVVEFPILIRQGRSDGGIVDSGEVTTSEGDKKSQSDKDFK